MFKCERCGSGYNGNYIGVESCPRCLLLDRVQAPLSFTMFKIAETEAPPASEASAPVAPPEPASQQSASSAA